MIAATDYIKALGDGIRPFVPGTYKVLGTDGFGRSDYRKALRSFFEVDRNHVAVAALKALADDQLLPANTVSEAISKYGIDPEKPNPARVLMNSPSPSFPRKREIQGRPHVALPLDPRLSRGRRPGA